MVRFTKMTNYLFQIIQIDADDIRSVWQRFEPIKPGQFIIQSPVGGLHNINSVKQFIFAVMPTELVSLPHIFLVSFLQRFTMRTLFLGLAHESRLYQTTRNLTNTAFHALYNRQTPQEGITNTTRIFNVTVEFGIFSFFWIFALPSWRIPLYLQVWKT